MTFLVDLFHCQAMEIHVRLAQCLMIIQVGQMLGLSMYSLEVDRRGLSKLDCRPVMPLQMTILEFLFLCQAMVILVQ